MLQSFEEKKLLLTLNAILATSQKTESIMVQIVTKKHWVTHESQRTDMVSTKVLVLTTKKKGCCMNGKKIWTSLLGEKHLLGKPTHFSVKNTVNDADTWRFIQQFFQHL